MTYKQIEASREARLWITQVIIPAGAIIVGALHVPEVRQAAFTQASNMKQSIKRKFKKD